MKHNSWYLNLQNPLACRQKYCLLLVCQMMFTFLSFGQTHDTAITLPMKNGKILYEKEHMKPGLTNDQLYAKALQWCRDSKEASGDDPVFTKEKEGGKIDGNIVFRVMVSNNGHYYCIKPAIHVILNDTACTVTLTDFYEKPVEPGISNEYSKLEYRWRDFRKGKPWSTEDQRLFRGIADHCTELMDSFENAMRP